MIMMKHFLEMIKFGLSLASGMAHKQGLAFLLFFTFFSFVMDRAVLASAWLPPQKHAAFFSYQRSESSTYFNSSGGRISQNDSRDNGGGEYFYKWSDQRGLGLFFNTAAVTASIPRVGFFGQQQLYAGSSSVLSVRVNLGQESGDGFIWPQAQWGISGSFSPEVAWFVDFRPGYWLWMNSRSPSLIGELGTGIKFFERHLLSFYYLWQQYDRSLTAKDYQREYVDINYFYQVQAHLRLGLGYHQFLSGLNHPAYSGWQIVSLWDWGE